MKLLNSNVEVSEKTAYGKTRYYPQNKLANELLKLMGQSTFTAQKLAQLQELGFLVVIQNQTVPFKSVPTPDQIINQALASTVFDPTTGDKKAHKD